MTPHFFRVSASAVLMTVGNEIDLSLTHRIARFVRLIDARQVAGLRDVIPSYTTVIVLYDPTVIAVSLLEDVLRELWGRAREAPTSDQSEAAVVDIPIVYDGADLDDVAKHAQLPVDEVVRRHAAADYVVGALGFAPGFAYLIGLPPELTTPRRARPRLAVPPGSVGIGSAQTGIYALPTPGGWSLIGRTPLRLFDPARDDPFVLRMGDRVRFRPIAARLEPSHPDTDQPQEVPQPTGDLEIVAGGMQTTVQDLGRFGYGRFGVSPNGAADRASLIAANRLVGNPDDAAGLEITLTGPHIRVRRPLTVAIVGSDLGARLNGVSLALGQRHRLLPGDELTFAPARKVLGARAYLAVAGGIDVPLVMGSRSTDLTAGFGGYEGRALRAGDVLLLGAERCATRTLRITPTRLDITRPLRVTRGPQADRFSDHAWKRLTSSLFTVSQDSNRVGLRLDGPALAPIDNADIISEGIVTGSIQVTGEGQPIVMLPGHATIGGYTKIATVIDEDLDRLGQLRPGDTVRFREVSPDEPDVGSTWSLPDLVRLARSVTSKGVEEFTFDDHADGASLRISRRPRR